jgi:hypothetical protein
MPRGGARLGAGRKPDPEKAEKRAAARAKPAEKAAGVIGAALTALKATAPDAPELPESLTVTYDDPLDFLAAVMNEPKVPLIARQDAAKALMPYKHPKKGETGKKQQAADAAKTSGSRFTAGAPPLRAVSNA